MQMIEKRGWMPPTPTSTPTSKSIREYRVAPL